MLVLGANIVVVNLLAGLSIEFDLTTDRQAIEADNTSTRENSVFEESCVNANAASKEVLAVVNGGLDGGSLGSGLV